MSEELKSCPFCGSKDVVTSFVHPTLGELWHYVVCKNCLAEGGADLGQSGAIERWNTRALETKFAALEAELAEWKSNAETAMQGARDLRAEITRLKKPPNPYNLPIDADGIIRPSCYHHWIDGVCEYCGHEVTTS